MSQRQRRDGGYNEKLHTLINSIFENDNSILINDNEELLNGALQRKIYKKAPCHYENKESYGDALITETLINLRDLIEIKEDDCIYFISDNIEDFSSKHLGKNYLHEHIAKDLIKNELIDMVNYRINFSKFIIEDLKEEIVNANLKEEFEKELEEEQAAEEAMYYSEHEDMLRESYGLSSLTSFDDWLRDKVSESHEVEKLLDLFESINKIYSELEELYYFYWDDFSTMINSYDNNEDLRDIDNNVIISKFNKLLLCNKEKFYCYSIEDIIEWISLQEDEICFEFDKLNLEDYISLDESSSIMDSKKRELILSWENVELYPENGEAHMVYCYLKELKNKVIISEGRVEINYGYVEEDDYGQAGDGCEATIDIHINSVIESIENIQQELEKLKAKHEKYVNYIKSEYNI